MENAFNGPPSEGQMIPRIFYSTETDSPFEKCTECGRSLLTPSVEYVVEKAYRVYPGKGVTDTVFEHALCDECVQVMSREMSKESLDRLHRYVAETVDWDGRLKRIAENSDRLEEWIAECLVTGDSIAAEEEYQVVASCRGNMIVPSVAPYAIGSRAMEQMASLLSEKTTDFLDDYSGRHFGLPPEFDLQPGPRLLPVL
jgi:hypothetical protein